VSNPYGRYGSQFSPDSINNQFGAGNPYSLDAPTNHFGHGLRILGDDDGKARKALTGGFRAPCKLKSFPETSPAARRTNSRSHPR
jgi:hypothetical protein